MEAVNAVLEATPETPSKFIAIIENKIVRNPLIEAVKSTQEVAEAIKVKDYKRALDLRGPEFAEYHKAYMMTTATDQPALLLPKETVRPAHHSALDPPGLTLTAHEHCHYPCRSSCWWNELSYKSSRCILSF